MINEWRLTSLNSFLIELMTTGGAKARSFSRTIVHAVRHDCDCVLSVLSLAHHALYFELQIVLIFVLNPRAYCLSYKAVVHGLVEVAVKVL